MADQSPRVGIVIPVYKVKQEYLDKCLDSVINQTYKNLEIVLVDDGSPDNCGELCEKHALEDSRIVVKHHEKNMGLPAARNTGFSSLTGECRWVTFLDSDDWLDYDTIEKVLNQINTVDPDVDVCLFPACRSYLDLEVRDERAKARSWNTREELDSLGIEALSIVYKSYEMKPTAIDTACAKLISKSFLLNNQISFRPLPFREDGMFFQEIVHYARKIIEVTVGMYHYRATNGSMVNSFRKNAPVEMKMFMDELKQFADSVGKDQKFYQAFYSYALVPVQLAVTQFFYHPDNKMNNREKYRECKRYLKQEPYRHMFENIRFLQLKRNFQIKYLCLRFGCYRMLALLRDFYNKKNNLTCYQ